MKGRGKPFHTPEGTVKPRIRKDGGRYGRRKNKKKRKSSWKILREGQ